MAKAAPNLDQRVIQVGGLLLIIPIAVGGWFGFNWLMDEPKREAVKPIAAEVKTTQRPRLVEFFANWSNPSNEYSRTVIACEEKYAGAIDIQRINVDEPRYAPLINGLKVKSVPRTLLFDKSGALIADIDGNVKAEELNKQTEKALHMQ